MEFHSLILFVSNFSEHCKVPLLFIAQNRLQVQIVRLDTTEARHAAANGKHFQIKNVPSLVVNYIDGNMQLYIGNDKIIPVLSAMRHVEPTGRGAPRSPSDQQSSGNMYSSYSHPAKPTYAPRPTPSRGPGGQGQGYMPEFDEPDEVVDPSGRDHPPPTGVQRSARGGGRTSFERDAGGRTSFERDIIIEEDDSPSFDEFVDPSPPAESAKKKLPPRKRSPLIAKGKNKVAQRKKPPVVFDEPDQEIEIEINEVLEETPRSTGRGGKMQNLVNQAKRFEQERKQTLGYDDDIEIEY